MMFRRLRTRMIAHIIWIVTTVALITFYFASKLHEQSIRRHLKADAAIATEITENIVLMAMQRKDPDVLHKLLPELSRLHHLKRIRIVQTNGRISFSSEPQEEGNVLDFEFFGDFINSSADTFTTHIVDGEDALFQKWRKIENQQECHECHDPAQKVRGISLVETIDSLSLAGLKPNLYVLIGIPLGVIIFLSLAAQVLFVRSVDRPIQNLKSAMNAMQKGNFAYRIANESQDELGQLAVGMNAMAKKLQEARKHLTEHHDQELGRAESIAKIGELAAGLAHEIKNPISGIVFAANSILRDTSVNDNRREIFEEIVKQANRVEQNLEALLTFARQSRLERFPTDINDIIKRIMLFIQQQPDMKLIKAESNLDENLPEALVDPKQIEQVLLNLIINAVQAMQNGGRLTIQTRFAEMDNIVRIMIRDTGDGIPEDIQEKVFQPFFTTKSKGVGLGLVLCKEVVTRHSGRIRFESKAGAGTIFTVELPVGSLETLQAKI